MQILFQFFILKIRTKFRKTPGFRTGDRAQDIPNMYVMAMFYWGPFLNT